MFLLKTLIVGSLFWLYTGEVGWAVEPPCLGGTSPDPAVLWCDDFDNGIPLDQKYFEYDNDGGDFIPVAGQGIAGSVGMQVIWQSGEIDAGDFKRTFGRNPVHSQSHMGTDFREIYWREYLRMADGWTGNPNKLSRATILATTGWAQAMIAHLWGGSSDYLVIDPATGIDASGNLMTTKYNDFSNLRWLGARTGTTPIFSPSVSGAWRCIETHVKLNAPGSSDGVFEFWIDGVPETTRTDLNWVGTWQTYGINAVFFENYWNAGAPDRRMRYMDNVVIATRRIGCLDTMSPKAPVGLRIQ